MRAMTRNEADDLVSELGTAEAARRYHLGPATYGPPSKLECMEIAIRRKEMEVILAPALAQIKRAFGR